MKRLPILLLPLLLSLVSCHSNSAVKEEEKNTGAGTPVTVAGVEKGAMEDYVELNATSSFLLKTYVKAVANGYLQNVTIKLGAHVAAGQQLFTLKTKEAQNLGNTVNQLDPSFKFNGLIPIKAPGSGYITQLAYQAGNYVQDGEQLAVISDDKSFVFILNVPYELKPYLPQNNSLQLLLPDGTRLDGKLGTPLPAVDSVSQTLSYTIHVAAHDQVPENLIAKVRLVKTHIPDAVMVSKAAVLTNETQDAYWIMKMTDSNTAVKIPIEKGAEAGGKVQVLSPALSAEDKILISGNYGLPDTAKVSVVNH
ncbi:efflux RND transporter periplasmic adaptor subunit [Chitinophagaceae bacterium MMS25-I14]